MTINLPKGVELIISELERHGFEGYAVGGCVRDSVLGRIPNDWDITTSAKPMEIKEIFPKTVDTGLQHGTVTVIIDKIGYEVTTYRIDGEYSDSRHPDQVRFTADLVEDLKRRDFTINAMAYNPKVGLVDEFGGMEDIKNKVIRCVGVAEDRFNEDALRIMRAVRFAAQLGYEIEENTEKAIIKLCNNLEKISVERIQAELLKLLLSDNPEKIRDMYQYGITKVFLPEFDAMMETEQNLIHHDSNVGEHTIRVIKHVPPQKSLRIAALLHDVCKPETKVQDEKGEDHFYGHPEKGAEKSKEILRRLRFDNDTIAEVSVLIRYHDYRPQPTKKLIRRMANMVGKDHMEELFLIKEADTYGQSDYLREEKFATINEYRRLYAQILEDNECFQLKDLAVDGRDLLQLGVAQGKEIGLILQELLEMVIENPELNTKEYLLEAVRKRG